MCFVNNIPTTITVIPGSSLIFLYMFSQIQQKTFSDSSLLDQQWHVCLDNGQLFWI